MKRMFFKICTAILALILLSCTVFTPAFAAGSEGMGLPQDNCTVSLPFAASIINLSCLYTEEMADQYMKMAGFTVVRKVNFDKDPADVSHTCAYVMGKTEIPAGDGTKTLLLISVRGTSGGEWQSNFDVAPSHRDDTQFAENFAYAAMEAFLTLKPDIDKEDRPLIIVCGYSRGAACANLLGALLDDEYGTDGIYVYTFATPCTVRGEMLNREYPNIFNFINPQDVVPRLPLESWGYGRLGTDVVLPVADPEAKASLDGSMEIMSGIAKGVGEYYSLRHSLTGPGADENGVSAFELMSSMSASFGSMTAGGQMAAQGDTRGMQNVSPESDLFPVLMLLNNLGGEHGQQVLMQHMPDTYTALIMRMMQQ